jgi:hypothetical protein
VAADEGNLASEIRHNICRASPALYLSFMKLATSLLLVATLALTACATSRDTSHFVPLGPKRGYYVIVPGSPLQDQLGYGRAPVKDTASPLHRGYGSDVIAFRFNRAGTLVAPPAYLAQLGPEGRITARLAAMTQGSTTWPQVQQMFPPRNQRIPQPDGGLLVYHEIPVYNALEEFTNNGIN